MQIIPIIAFALAIVTIVRVVVIWPDVDPFSALCGWICAAGWILNTFLAERGF